MTRCDMIVFNEETFKTLSRCDLEDYVDQLEIAGLPGLNVDIVSRLFSEVDTLDYQLAYHVIRFGISFRIADISDAAVKYLHREGLGDDAFYAMMRLLEDAHDLAPRHVEQVACLLNDKGAVIAFKPIANVFHQKLDHLRCLVGMGRDTLPDFGKAPYPEPEKKVRSAKQIVSISETGPIRNALYKQTSEKETIPANVARKPNMASTYASNAAKEGLLLTFGRGVKMELIGIEAGTFRPVATKPPQEVTIGKAFYIGKYPVTQRQWIAVMRNNPSKFRGDDLPVETVSYHECMAFCRELSEMTGKIVRLPMEAEWEYACQAGTEMPYSFGNDVDDLKEYAWYDDNSNGQPHPVGEKKPNAWGLYDMHGNVREWCCETHDEEAWSRLPFPQEYRALCGGSWFSNFVNCCTSHRSWAIPDCRDCEMGFRVVVEA